MKKSLFAALAALLLLTGCAQKAPEMAVIPDVVGLDESAALDALMNAHLSINWEPEEVGKSLADVIEWVAVSQTQTAGSEVEEMTKVTVQFERIKPAPEPTTEPAEDDEHIEPDPELATPSGLVEEAEAAMRSSYGWPDEPHYSAITGFSGMDAPRLTVITSMANKAENEQEAMGLCMTLISVNEQISAPFRGVHVTAGEGGPFLAVCDNPNY